MILRVLFVLNFLYSYAVLSQGATGNMNLTSELPTIIGPSPAVASLMRFEEIPVNEYTGMPQIDIPIFSTKTLYSKLNFNMGLSYHASSVNADEIAPYTGLGWNLMAGGVISRTVRGLPDEYLEYASTAGKGKVGIFHNNPGGILAEYSNYYYVAEGLINGGYDPNNEVAEFKWDGYEHGKYDTQHDLYQFNFMGHSGRFIIRKNVQNNRLNVVPLDNNTNYKINIDYDPETFGIEGFTIIDENGINYIFDEIDFCEYTSSASFLTYFDNSSSSSITSMVLPYPTAFHLTKVKDPFGNPIITFTYKDHLETTYSNSATRNTLISPTVEFIRSHYGDQDFPQNIKRMKPKEIIGTTTTEIKSKKIKIIEISGIAKIILSTDSQRDDSNLPPNHGAQKLQSVVIKDWRGNLRKKLTFRYDYHTVPYSIGTGRNLKRLILTEVRDYGRRLENPDYQSYKLTYNDRRYSGRVIKNPWGYFELEPQSVPDVIEKNYATVGVLERMQLPTGGEIKFNFEASTYSFIGKDTVTDFHENPENTQYLGAEEKVLRVGDQEGVELFYSGTGSIIAERIILEIDIRNLRDNFLKLRSINNITGEAAPDMSIPCSGEEWCNFSFSPDQDYSYSLYVLNQYMGSPFEVPFTVVFLEPTTLQKQYVHGGGIRIKSVEYYENTSGTVPTIKKDYDYSLLSDNSKSSGALSYPKPLFDYGITLQTHFTTTLGIVTSHDQPPVTYNVKTKLNNLSYVKTHGADVGYKNVTVKSITPDFENNGKIESTFLSPIDFPETGDDPDHFDGYMLDYPFLPSHNYDYKRGLLKNQRVLNNINKTIKETHNSYGFSEEELIITGISLSLDLLHQCPYAYRYKFDDYLYYVNNDQNHVGVVYCDAQGFPASHIRMLPMREAKGWTKLTKSVVTEYFDSFYRIINGTEFTYNESNKQLHSKKVGTSNPEETEITEFLYPNDMLATEPFMAELIAANRIVEPIEVRKTLNQNGNDILLHTTRAEYDLFPNGTNKYLPKYIHTFKGGTIPINTSQMDTRIVYHDYDDYSNPRDVSKKDGPRTAYIWGYNNQYPVAKVENATYLEATNSALGLNFNKINNPSNTEQLQGELRKIRYGLSKAMVTTFTYFPLVGIESVTDPKGETIWYKYDDFGRLEKTRDLDEQILSETNYHYRSNP
ncbi:hypothetical protein EI546_09680 [Aequorivita sp. H23M31]|uniref:RHS repeat protein n=1 Tax=Aequorivita ciconiae TaxID=2494375 RepID=A0A410G3Y6_9FLAO|nr:hypothetical protein [Aequorivita sp. H23M31]QAA81976.1 hypothetical protein EI546_09680 [Aequorivita sp. H23M31]